MKKLEKYVKKRTDNIDSLLEKSGASFTPNDFHSFRVEIKKLKCAAAIINDARDKFRYKQTTRPFRQLFKKAGQVRNADIESALLAKYPQNALRQYRKALREKRQLSKGRFVSFVQKINTSEMKHSGKKIASQSKDVSKKDVADYLKSREKELSQYLKKQPLKQQELHELRKILKETTYAQSILAPKNGHENKYLSSLSETLGKWHDIDITLAHLRRIAGNKTIPRQDQVKVNRLIQKLRQQNENYLEIIRTKIGILNKQSKVVKKTSGAS